MSALTNPLSVADGMLWLGAAPVAGGRGIALTPAGIVLHETDEEPETVEWSRITALHAAVEVSRWRRPALASWTIGMLGAALDIFSPGVPDEVGLRIDTADRTIEHAANAHNRGGYPRDKVEALRALLDLLVTDARERAALTSPEVVRETFGRAADVVSTGGSPEVALRPLAGREH